MINTEKDRGGAARMANTLVNAINQQESDVQAILAHCGDDDLNEAFRGYKKSYAFYLNIIQTRLLGSHRIYDFGISDEIIKLAKDADVIHLHNLHGYYLDFVKLINNIGNKPIVWTWHDMWGATGRCGFAMDCEKWKMGCHTCEHLDYYPKVWVDNASSEYKVKSNLFKKMENLYIVSPSDWLRDIVVESGFNADRAITIPNPVDLGSYKAVDKVEARNHFNLPEEPLLLFVAHDCNDERKRYKDFEKVSLNSGIKGVVVGVPPENKNSDLIYLGKLNSSNDLANAYSAADAFVITSKSDNYPNTVIESMACGVPVFGYAIGGIPSQMPEGWDGLVDYKDITELSNKIKNYFKNCDEHADAKHSMIDHAISNWDPEIVANKYCSLYKRLYIC
ncbi:MAG: glycosyltransferase [Gammaproteobacteria bacterium]|nr:glycosyltransferase [Gammaproteobacteria bacterium]